MAFSKWGRRIFSIYSFNWLLELFSGDWEFTLAITWLGAKFVIGAGSWWKEYLFFSEKSLN